MASRSLNKVTLIGNLTRDPELKYTPSGAAVCSFGLATNRSWVTAEGQTKEDTQFHRIVAWNKLAELCGKILTKGRKVYVEGRLVYRSYTGKDGLEKNITEIVLDDFIVFSDGRRADGEEYTQSPKQEAVEVEPAYAEKKEDEAVAEEEDEPKSKKSKKDEDDKSEDVDPDDIPF